MLIYLTPRRAKQLELLLRRLRDDDRLWFPIPDGRIGRLIPRVKARLAPMWPCRALWNVNRPPDASSMVGRDPRSLPTAGAHGSTEHHHQIRRSGMEQQTTILPTLPPGAHLVTSDVVRTRLEGSEYQTEGLYANGRRECAYHIRHYRRHGGRVVTQEHGACWAFYYDGDAAKPLMVLTLNRELR